MEAKNYVEKYDENNSRLEIKVFCGKPSIVEAEINKWLDCVPVDIQEMKQTESQGPEGFGITITFLYYKRGMTQFITKEITAMKMAEMVAKYMKDFWGITVEDIQEHVFSKEVMKPKTS